MQELKIPEKLKRNVQDFISGLKEIYAQGLVSVILYGSAAGGEFNDKNSNLNLLIVLNDTDLENLSKSASLINKFAILNPLFLTENYIKSSLDIFPIEFLDMQENYFVLYGKDVLKNINVETKNLRFQCEQELKAKLINLKQSYLRIYRDRAALNGLLAKSFTSVTHILRNVLRLKGKKPAYQKENLLGELGLEFQIDAGLWKRILTVKNRQIKLNYKDADCLFIDWTRQLEKIVDIVDGL